MRLTERDVRTLELVHRFRLLTREQIQRLEFSTLSTTVCKRRLTALYHHGLLGRIGLSLHNAYGATRAVYFVDKLGARVLDTVAGLEGIEPYRRDSGSSELFLQHTLDVADVRIAFTLACQSRYRLEWWNERMCRRSRVGPLLSATGPAVRGVPDAYFIIHHGATDGFALELDRGTVPERRMRTRFLSYGNWVKSGAYQRDVPCPSLRVLVVVAGPAATSRLSRLKRWCEDEGGRSLFWFADRGALEDADALHDAIWQVAGADQPRSLALSAVR